MNTVQRSISIRSIVFSAASAAFFFLAVTATGHASTYYVDASAGNDSYNGLATTAIGSQGPWKTIDKVNSATIQAGDSILFKRGQIWSKVGLSIKSNGIATAPIVYGAYGVGDSPILDGLGLIANVIEMSNRRWVTLDHLHIRNSYDTNIRARGDTNGIVITNCFVEGSSNAHGLSWEGKNLIVKQTTFYNNGVGGGDHAIYLDNCSGTSANVLIEKCVFNAHKGGSLKINSCNVGRIGGIVVRRNLFKDDKWALVDDYASDGAEYAYNVFFGSSTIHDGPEIILTSNAGTFHAQNAKIYNNVFHHTPKTGYYTIQIYAGSTGHEIRNNIFYSGGNAGGYINIAGGGSAKAIDHNIYFGGTVKWSNQGAIYTSLSGWNDGTGFDSPLSSAIEDPAMNDVDAHDFTLRNTSRARDNGIGVGYNTDFLNRVVPYGTGVDIGAYEYASPPLMAPPANLQRTAP